MAKEELETAARAMMAVTAKMPGDLADGHAYPVLGIGSNYDSLPKTLDEADVDDVITQDIVLKLVRAALFAVQLPTKAMIDAGAARLGAGDQTPTSEQRRDAAEVFKAMMRNLLND
ncbi:hypothetical protein [Beijerinckia sp. L45]|uniref:hypothetical protein n=1 Tax=Beijerinckia sp. L45 TaxID=1641855 RepID=UPI00131AF8D8|nr:hypothetical protein [Beijerinckia sp. L45]